MYPNQYLDYLIHYHIQRDYFECHEILEEYWKKVTRPLEHNQWVALIQLAVGNYHHRRGNVTGANRMYHKSITLISKYKDEINELGLEVDQLLIKVEKLLKSNPFTDIHLPMSDSLLKACQNRCHELGIKWLLPDNTAPVPDYILNKHCLRDRSEVIVEREKQLKKKQT
ncbi:DUF309 domain-containing protein [Bacillus sp. JCM 19034]|uniref:DUF309 domain-containing protein n=1 Tax=Bacillus sp. JCM 19034 TaxID=1481928 RepID=UPI0007822D22|nr:DUF309 domain-containing protein [Bacillus sp. JCM 19034]